MKVIGQHNESTLQLSEENMAGRPPIGKLKKLVEKPVWHKGLLYKYAETGVQFICSAV